ncbi:MAG: hypothetical protein AAFV49_15055, partial [Pseudomonadota bacterium]
PHDTVMAFGDVIPGVGSMVQTPFQRAILSLPPELEGRGGRARLPGAEEAFEAHPAVRLSGRWPEPDAHAVLDWSQTRHGGTAREGFVAPLDLAARPRLSGDKLPLTQGARGGPGLLTREEMTGSFTDLPDWLFERFEPAAFAPDAAIADPWATPDPRRLFLNMQIERRAAGTIAEEIAADGSGWRLELLPQSFRPRFTLFAGPAEGGAVLMQVTDMHGVQDGERLMLGVETAFLLTVGEPYYSNTSFRRALYEHRRVAGHRAPLALEVVTARHQPVPDPARRTIWLQPIEKGVRIREWQAGSWRDLHGDLAAAASAYFWTFSPKPGKRFSLYLDEDFEAIDALARPGDYAFTAERGLVQRDRKGRWHNRLIKNMRRPYGLVSAYFRVGGRFPHKMGDWIWSTRPAADQLSGEGRDIPVGTLRVGAATAAPAEGLRLRYFEARRQGTAQLKGLGGIPVWLTGTELRFAATPEDPATGDRGAYYGPADVWLTAP